MASNVHSGTPRMHPLIIVALWTGGIGTIAVVAEATNTTVPAIVAAIVSAVIAGWPHLMKALAHWRSQEEVEAVEHKLVAETAQKQALHNVDTLRHQSEEMGKLEAKIDTMEREQFRLRRITHSIAAAAQGIMAHTELSKVTTTRLLRERGMSQEEIDAALPPPPPIAELVKLIQSIDPSETDQNIEQIMQGKK